MPSEVYETDRPNVSNIFLVLRRSEHVGIGLEDVDTLQLELEALLSATVVRKVTLKEETKVLSNIEKYKNGGKLHKRVSFTYCLLPPFNWVLIDNIAQNEKRAQINYVHCVLY